MHEATLDRAPTSLPGYRRIFASDRLTLGLFFPIEAFAGDRPTMLDQVALAQAAEAVNIGALWVRDVPLRVPSFGDAGQIYDPWVWLGTSSRRPAGSLWPPAQSCFPSVTSFTSRRRRRRSIGFLVDASCWASRLATGRKNFQRSAGRLPPGARCFARRCRS